MLRAGAMSIQSNTLAWPLLVCAVLAAGVAVPLSPEVAFAILGLSSAALLLLAPAHWWVIAALGTATLSRLLVAWGLAPSLLNFCHFPLVVGAAAIAIIKPSPTAHRTANALGFGVLGLLLLCLLSWLVGGGEPARPFFAWLVLCEPFLLVYAILRCPPPPQAAARMWGMIMGLAAIQFVLGLYQSVAIGTGDTVQGTFIGQGAGAHIAGAICLTGVMIAVARSPHETTRLGRLAWLAAAGLLFLIPILGDANQATAAFLPAIGIIFLSSRGLKVSQLILPGVGILAVVYAGFLFYPPLQRLADKDILSRGIRGKTEAVAWVAGAMSHSAAGWIVGLGPGNTVSRVALLSVGATVKGDSPIRLLGLKMAPITGDLLLKTKNNWMYASSSAWSGISSWLGLLGDLGIAGVALYLWIAFRLWSASGGDGGWQAGVARGTLLMVGLLGGLFSWLEEPGYTLVAATVVGLALIATNRAATSPNSPPPQRTRT
jgi:hypothetical protein